ncbi:hypothetical protein ACFXPV_20680 [Streptomyces sp. NPDC059118]|uniref:hypothetical protein n=1 Tax=unclassified Streptomyces TaxID=2593676 RepID=UPI0036AEC20D
MMDLALRRGSGDPASEHTEDERVVPLRSRAPDIGAPMLVAVPDQGDRGFSRGRDRRTPPLDEPHSTALLVSEDMAAATCGRLRAAARAASPSRGLGR